MKFRLLVSLSVVAAVSALSGCVMYDDYGYDGYYREPTVVYRRHGGYPYGYYDGYYGGYYGYGAPYYRYGYGYPYYGHGGYPGRYYYRPPYRGDHGHRPPSGGGSGKPPWRDLNRLRQAEGQHPMIPPARASRPPSPAAPAYRPAPPSPAAPVNRPSSGAGDSEHRREGRRIRAEMKSGGR